MDEFNEIFNDVLDANLLNKRKMLCALVNGARTGQEIADEVGLAYNGHVIDTLVELEVSGFVAKDNGFNPITGKMSKVCRYRLSDNYTRFYLKYIDPKRAMIDKDAYRFTSLEELPGWNAIMGLQFECLVINNLPLVMRHAGIERTLLDSAAPFAYKGMERGEGFQIDLLLKASRCLYVVEIKRKARIGEEIMDEVQAKIRKMSAARQLSVFPIRVYEGELSRRVPADGFFKDIIDVAGFRKR